MKETRFLIEVKKELKKKVFFCLFLNEGNNLLKSMNQIL